ncbi:hypothetical protein N7457_005146 [Penicillium paradoxum]|uniref:uncharacterized protein n=1 Tax=Penicillium paradoxum TaxID=176176 RepID=UPI0025480585|nr:uncharacterized protein N7457_005146 [Penicillium paradoxum]KAJ5779986.1 hypothetical protein N7457_005146 [Penicillium paradoxum]
MVPAVLRTEIQSAQEWTVAVQSMDTVVQHPLTAVQGIASPVHVRRVLLPLMAPAAPLGGTQHVLTLVLVHVVRSMDIAVPGPTTVDRAIVTRENVMALMGV